MGNQIQILSKRLADIAGEAKTQVEILKEEDQAEAEYQEELLESEEDAVIDEEDQEEAKE